MDDKLQRIENETDKEYQTRLTKYKLVDGEDIDWEDIKDLLDSPKHRDTLRREGYGIEIAIEVYEKRIEQLLEEHYMELRGMKEKVNREIEDKRLKEIESKVRQLELEKIKLKDQRNDLNAIKRTIARTEHLIECMRDKMDKLNTTKPLLGDVALRIENKEREGVVLLSDIHYGAETDNILDCYNPDICRKKMNYLCNEIIRLGQLMEIDTINLFGLGDYITGLIHNINRIDSRLLITEQVLEASELIAEFINELSNKFYVKYALIQGNHSRIVAERNNSVEEENFTEFIRPFVAHRLKDNKNVEYIPHKDVGIIEMEIKGNKCVGIHGDNDKDRNLNRLIEMFDYKVDYVFRAHFHQSKQFDFNNTVIVNNGAFGGEGYGKKNRLYNRPIQKFLTFTEKGMEGSFDIDLNNYKK